MGVLALASAVSLSHTEVGLQQLQQIAGRSSFGQNVLEELQSKLDTGSPLDELKSILKEINTRLSEAQTADDAQNEAHQAQCAAWLADLDIRIASTEADIARIEGLIVEEENTIARLNNEIAASDERIADHKRNIAGFEQEIVEANETRRAEHEMYVNRTRDTGICIDAIAEIKATEGLDKLSDNQGKEASTYSADFYNHAATNGAFLQTLSTKVQDGNAKNLVLLAAAAVSTLDKGDVDTLNGLLDKLTEELKKYGEDLDAQEAEDQKLYEENIARLQTLIFDEKAALAAEELVNAGLREDLRIAKANLVALKAELAAAKAKLASLQETRRQDEAKCKALEAAYDERTADRQIEGATLAEIERIIIEKLDTSADHLKDAIDHVTVQ